jgi:FMN phosphatase YigB (HAD superfamily)
MFVGDSFETDVLGARGAGLRPLLLEREGSASADAPPDVERIFSLHDLVELVDVRAPS